MQSYIDPLPNPDDGSISLQEYRVGSIPTQQQCEDVLKRWLMWHELDIEQAQDNVWATLSCHANNRSVDETENLAQWLNSLPDGEVVDFEAIKLELYKVLKLGGGASSNNGRIGLLRVAMCLHDQLYGCFCLMLQLGHLHLLLTHSEYISILCSVPRLQSVWLLMRLVGCVGGVGGGLLAVPRGYVLKD